MKLVMRARDGVVEFNWMFVPTFIGMNSVTKKQIEDLLAEKFDGRTINDTTLREMHGVVLEFLCAKFPIPGLRKYLLALEHISEKS